MANGTRVLHVIDSLRLGGAESLLVALVRELRRSGRSWNAVCVPKSDDADPGLVESVRAQADAFLWLPPAPLYDPRLTRAVRRAVVASDAQVVHSHLSIANISSRAAAASSFRPHMATIHTMPGPTAQDSRLRTTVDGWSAWLSQRLVAPSEEIGEAFRAAFHLPGGRFRVIPNSPAAQVPPAGFDREAFRRALVGERARHLVVTVARLQPEKGIASLVAAAGDLREKLPGLHFAVAGSGGEEASLRRQIDDTGLADTVSLLGTRSDVGALLAAADAFCLPSRREGLPISLLEAMQAGLPCVATRVGGIPGLIDDGANGLLVEPDDVGGLAVALERILRDAGLASAMGARARALVSARYSLAAAAGAYADVYDELACAAPG